MPFFRDLIIVTLKVVFSSSLRRGTWMYMTFDRALKIIATIYKIRAQLDKGENSRVYLLSDKIFLRTKFSTPSRNFNNFVRYLPDFCI